MSKRTLRKLPRIDYAVLHDSGERTPYSQIRESPQESDGSSEESLSGSDNSQDRTLIRDEVESEGLSVLSEELRRLSVVSPPTRLNPSINSVIEPQQSIVGSHTDDPYSVLAVSPSAELHYSNPTASSSAAAHYSESAVSSTEPHCSYPTASSPTELNYSANLTESDPSLLAIMGDNPELRKLLSAQDALHDDLVDFIDEESVYDVHTVDDINLFVAKLEDLRSKYRNVHKEISSLVTDEEEYKKIKVPYEKMLNSIKRELAEAKRLKVDIRGKEYEDNAKDRYNKAMREREEYDKRENSISFLFVEVGRLMNEIVSEVQVTNISSDRNILSDKNLVEMKKQLPGIQKRIDNFSGKYTELLKLVPDQVGPRKAKLDAFATNFNLMLKDHRKYQEYLQREVTSSQIEKEKKFQTSSLKINLPKFK